MPVIDSHTIIERNNDKFIASKMGNEMVMMNKDNGDFISINSVGADIWDLLEKPTSLTDLINALTANYNIPAEQCKSETVAFLTASSEQGIFLFH